MRSRSRSTPRVTPPEAPQEFRRAHRRCAKCWSQALRRSKRVKRARQPVDVSVTVRVVDNANNVTVRLRTLNDGVCAVDICDRDRCYLDDMRCARGEQPLQHLQCAPGTRRVLYGDAADARDSAPRKSTIDHVNVLAELGENSRAPRGGCEAEEDVQFF